MSSEEILAAAIRNKLTIDNLITLSPPALQRVIYCRTHQRANCVHDIDGSIDGDYEHDFESDRNL